MPIDGDSKENLGATDFGFVLVICSSLTRSASSTFLWTWGRDGEADLDPQTVLSCIRDSPAGHGPLSHCLRHGMTGDCRDLAEEITNTSSVWGLPCFQSVT